MKLLLDECVPRKLKDHLPGCQCITVPDAGWAGRTNGELLCLAEESGFDVFLTLDRGLEYEQNLRNRKIAVLLVAARSNRLADLLPQVPAFSLCFPHFCPDRCGGWANLEAWGTNRLV